ncbi:MAG: hypothetical protein Q8K63_06505 [Acidimicrobiales bacterium]|nr:hypothetical protein [Acidimicrobiales bacterium]
MGQATIAQAEQTLASLSGLSDDQRRQFRYEIDEAKANATHMATEEVERITGSVRAQREDLLREACDVRDGFAVASTAQDLSHLRRRHAQIVRAIEALDEATDSVESIENDLVGFAENLFTKYPGTRPHFTFV